LPTCPYCNEEYEGDWMIHAKTCPNLPEKYQKRLKLMSLEPAKFVKPEAPESFPRPSEEHIKYPVGEYHLFVHKVYALAKGMPIPSRDLMEITGFLWRMKQKGFLGYVTELLKGL